jgi:hypothetical protein
MTKKEKWITCEEGESADIKNFSTDLLKFGREVLDWFGRWDEIKEWEKMYEQDNSKRIEDYVEEITNGRIEYDWNDAMFLNTRTGSYIKAN